MRDQRIIELRAQGLTQYEIGQELGLGPGYASVLVSNLIGQGLIERSPNAKPRYTQVEREARDTRVIALRDEQGMTFSAIGNELGVSTSHARNFYEAALRRRRRLEHARPSARHGDLIPLPEWPAELTITQAFRIEDEEVAATKPVDAPVAVRRGLVRQRGRTAYSKAMQDSHPEILFDEIDERIVQFRDSGLTNTEIISQLSIPGFQIVARISKLIKANHIESRKQRPTVEMSAEQRAETIIAMTKEGATLAEIGERIGVTKERVRQLKVRLARKRRDPQLFALTEGLLSIKEVADRLGVKPYLVWQLCSTGAVEARRRGKRDWILTEEVVSQLRQQLENQKTTVTRTCIECGGSFECESLVGNPGICSESCRARRRQKLHQQGPARIDSKWRRAVRDRLKGHEPTDDEEWLTLSDASKRSRLSAMQITWLAKSDILSVKPHPTKRWGGRLTNTYAASQLEIAGEIYQEHQES